MDVDPTACAGELSVEQRQFVEIARALSFGARFVILDEPTAKLDARGIERLFDKLRALQRQGVAFKVYDLCTTVTVYRGARHIVTAPVAEFGRQALVEAMTGESARGSEPARSMTDRQNTDSAALLEVSGHSLVPTRTFALTARPGEVVGLAGAAASGNVQLGETLAGLHRPQVGTITVSGRPVRTGRVPAALAGRPATRSAPEWRAPSMSSLTDTACVAPATEDSPKLTCNTYSRLSPSTSNDSAAEQRPNSGRGNLHIETTDRLPDLPGPAEGSPRSRSWRTLGT